MFVLLSSPAIQFLLVHVFNVLIIVSLPKKQVLCANFIAAILSPARAKYWNLLPHNIMRERPDGNTGGWDCRCNQQFL